MTNSGEKIAETKSGAWQNIYCDVQQSGHRVVALLKMVKQM